jgi:hypothetical protein
MERNRYVDLLRVGAMVFVVIGHWLATDVTYRSRHLSGIDALGVIGWGRWLTLIFQVMPVFFLVGGYANATSWTAHHDRGQTWATWVRGRALRLLRPATVYVAIAVLAVVVASLTGFSASELAKAAWFITLQLWFLPVYLLLIAATPALLALHRRFGLAVPAAMAVGVALVDIAVIGWRVPVIGFANYLLGWGVIHQCGFAWHDGTLTRRRWPKYALLGGGLVALAGLVRWGPFPVDMIGVPGEVVENANPPSIALLAFAAVQTGLLLAAEPVGRRMIAKPRRWGVVNRLNQTTMTVYLWHMVPVVLIAVALYPAGLVPQPGVGSWQWWALRPAWIGVLVVVLVPVVFALRLLERPVERLLPDRPVAAPRWAAALLWLGLGGTVIGLIRLTITGFAPGGRLDATALAGYTVGLGLTVISGYASRRSTPSSPSGPATGPAGGPVSLARRRAGLSAPSSSAPPTHTSPPLTTENVVETSWATTPASTLPSAGAVVTWARYKLVTRPRRASGV